AADVARAADALRAAPRTIGLLPTLESAHGLSNAAAIAAASPRVLGLQLGFADLLESLGIAQDHVFARQQIRLQVRLAAAQAHVPCYDSAYADFTEEAGYRAQLASARSLGFAGASCIHPRQVPIANEIFSPTAEEIHTARQIVAAAAHAATQGLAVFALDGRMIDKPFLDRAKAILAEAEQQ
ncbi:MAG TPA: aldolase/citrate lyase family protein, partial [Acidobacteriaceae bacterium]